MKIGLKAGDRSEVGFVVTSEMIAAFEGRVVHEVLSTFHLVYYAEYAARKLLEPSLEEGEDAVGAEINLRHLLPSRIGDEIEVTATLKLIDGRKVVCDIRGLNGGREICSGTQTQILVRKGDSASY